MSFLDSLFKRQQDQPTTTIGTAVDMVTYVAGLASNPGDIDPLLDILRGITAKLQPGQQPSAKDTEALVDTYLHIEQYLTTKEPLRTFTKEELRSRFTPQLRSQIESYQTKVKP